MKQLFSILSLLAWFNFYAQKNDDIFKKDTLYICFDYGKNQEVKTNPNIHPSMGETKTYYFRFHKDFISFTKRKYLDYDAMDIDKKSDIKIVKKRFLQKNKDKILGYSFFLKQKELRLVYFQLDQKVFYLIDKKEIKRNKIKLKEVKIFSSFAIEE